MAWAFQWLRKIDKKGGPYSYIRVYIENNKFQKSVSERAH